MSGIALQGLHAALEAECQGLPGCQMRSNRGCEGAILTPRRMWEFVQKNFMKHRALTLSACLQNDLAWGTHLSNQRFKL